MSTRNRVEEKIESLLVQIEHETNITVKINLQEELSKLNLIVHSQKLHTVYINVETVLMYLESENQIMPPDIRPCPFYYQFVDFISFLKNQNINVCALSITDSSFFKDSVLEQHKHFLFTYFFNVFNKHFIVSKNIQDLEDSFNSLLIDTVDNKIYNNLDMFLYDNNFKEMKKYIQSRIGVLENV